MFDQSLWLGVLVVASLWTLLIASGSPSTLEIVKAWSAGVLMGALAGSLAGYAAASVSLDWQWPVGLVVGAVVCIGVATYRGKTAKSV